MSLTFDAVGPSSAGAGNSGSATLSWSHAVTGASTLLLAAVAVGASGNNDGSFTISSVTYGGTAMTRVGSVVHPGGDTFGYLALYKLVGAAAGTASIVVTMNTAPTTLGGGSLSFAGADQTNGVGTPATATGSGTTATESLATTSGRTVASFAAAGSSISSATSPSTSRFISNVAGSSGAGNLAGATSPSTGSSVTTAWTVSAFDLWAVIEVEVLAATGTSAPAGAATATATAPPPVPPAVAAPAGLAAATGTAPAPAATVAGGVTVVQHASSSNVSTVTFGSNVAAGNSVLLSCNLFTTSGGTISSSAPLFAGSAVTGATQLSHKQSAGTNGVCLDTWLLPDLPGGSGAVSITITGSVASLIAIEVAGLGTAPAAGGLVSSGAGTGTASSSGSIGPVSAVPSIVVGASVGFGEVQPNPGSPWTFVADSGSGFGALGYQVIGTAGSSYTYAVTQPGSATWAADVVAVSAAVAQTASAGLASATGTAPAPAASAGGSHAGAAAATGTAPGPAAGIGLHAPAGLAGAGAAAPGPRIPGPARFVTSIAGTGTGQYFADQFGEPLLIRGDSAWGLPLMAGAAGGPATYESDIDFYVTTRAAQGFNAFIIVGVGTAHYSNFATDAAGDTWDSVPPFTGGDPGTLNSAYWDRVDYALTAAEAAGMTVFMDPAPSYAFEDAGAPLNGASDTDFGNLGTALGTRYASAPNLVWLFGDDWNGFNGTQFDRLLAGIRGAGDTHLVSVENEPESTSRHDLSTSDTDPWGIANAQWNLCYTYNAGYAAIEYAYAESSPLAVLHADGSYDGDTYITQNMRDYMRNLLWWALTSGSRGFIYGRVQTWPFPATILADLVSNTFDSADLAVIWDTFGGLPGWHQLIPDTSSALVTAGRGTHLGQIASFDTYGGGNTYVSAGATPDGTLAVIYIPDATGTITVDDSGLVPGYTATWVDPVSGATSPATIASTYSHPAANSISGTDWVLVLAAPTDVSGTAGAAAGTGSAGEPRGGAGSLPAAAAAAGSGGQPAAHIGALAGAAQASGSAPGPSAAAAAEAGIAAAAGSAPAPEAAGGPSAGTAAGSGAAPQPSVSTIPAASAPAGLATAAGTAPQPSAGITASAGPAAADGAAPQPAVAAGVRPGAAQATGTAPGPAVSTVAAASAPAGLAAGAGAAERPAAAISAPAGSAAGAGTAGSPSAGTAAGVTALAGLASATGTAHGAVIPAHVTGTASAAMAKMSLAARSRTTSNTGTLAYQGSPPFTVPAGTIGGVVTLNGTTAVSVAATAVSASSLILLTVQPGTAPAGWPRVASITPGTGFTLKSGSGSDTAVVCGWYILAAV